MHFFSDRNLKNPAFWLANERSVWDRNNLLLSLCNNYVRYQQYVNELCSLCRFWNKHTSSVHSGDFPIWSLSGFFGMSSLWRLCLYFSIAGQRGRILLFEKNKWINKLFTVLVGPCRKIFALGLNIIFETSGKYFSTRTCKPVNNIMKIPVRNCSIKYVCMYLIGKQDISISIIMIIYILKRTAAWNFHFRYESSNLD